MKKESKLKRILKNMKLKISIPCFQGKLRKSENQNSLRRTLPKFPSEIAIMQSSLKRIGLLILFLGVVLLISGFVNAKIMTTKGKYTSVDSISVLSDQDPLCFSAEGDVHLFIVKKDGFSDGNKLEDVRGDFTLFSNSKVTQKVWENALVGGYNIVIDCNTNNDYDVGEPISDVFDVVFKTANGQVLEGDKNPDDFSWYYDSEEGDFDNVLLQLKLSATFEDIELNNATVEFGFPGKNKIEKLEVYVDGNNNGKLENGENLIGWIDPGVLREGFFFLNSTLKAGEDKNLLFIYKMKGDSEEGEYKLKVLSIFGTGFISEKMIRFSGLSISSNVLTVLPEKSCLGEILMGLTPSLATEDSKVVAKISNLNGCDGKDVLLKRDPCYMFSKPNIGSCELVNGKCEIEFNAIEGKYFACVYKNDDLDYGDFGEVATQDLVVQASEVIVDGEKEIVVGELEDEDESSDITGEVVNERIQDVSDELAIDFGATSSFMVLLEVTLLLILFVLILISFKLKNPSERVDEEIEPMFDVEKSSEESKRGAGVEEE